MNKICFIAVIFVSTLFLLPSGTALAQHEERLAVVSEYEGDVKVEHESIKKTVTRIGNRIRNSAVYENGSVMTMHDSTADLVFNDNTSLEIDEDSSLIISSREMSGEEKTEGGFIRQVSGKQSEIVRNIHVKAGKFLANITPSKSVLTEFETPTGTASVRGTAFTLAYIAGVTSIDLTQGLIDFADAGHDVSFSVEPGDNIDISLSELGHSSIGVNAGQLDVATETGTLIIESGESTHVDVDADTGEVHVTADEGTVDFETSTGMAIIEEGEMAGTSVDADTGEVTISSEEGSVVFETETGIATIEEGASATTSKDCTDSCKISLGAEDGTVEFETSSGKVVIEDGEAAGTKVDKDTGKISVSSEEGMIGFESHMGNVMMGEGDVIGALLNAETGEVIMTAEVGTMEFETAMGRAMMEEGEVVGALLDAETGKVIMTSEVGMVEFETTMGKVMMDEGEAMGAHIDTDTGEMFMSAEQGDITFETSAGTASLEHGEIVGTAFDQDTGQVTMMAMEGDVSFDTPMGMAVMQEGAVMEVTFDDNTGEMSMSSGGGSYTLETDNGIITMEDGGSMEFAVDHNTGEITVTGVTGDVVMTNEDGTMMTIEAGTNLGIMHDDGHDGPMDGDGYDGPMDGGGHDGPDGEGPEDGTFEGNVTQTDGGMIYDGVMTDEFGMWSGAYNESTDQFVGTLQLNDGNSFTFNSDGSVTDQYGNALTQQQIQQLMSQADGKDDDESHGSGFADQSGVPTSYTLDEPNAPGGSGPGYWSEGSNAYTTDSFGPINTIIPANANTHTGDFEESFGSTASFAVIHTGFGNNGNSAPGRDTGFMEAVFNFASADHDFSFDYNFITTENPFGSNPVNDMFTAKLIFADGSVHNFLTESVVNSKNLFTSVSGLPGNTLDSTDGYQTGWRNFFESMSGLPTDEDITLRFEVIDDSDNFADSAVLLDNVVDPPVVVSSTDYLLTFAKVLRGDIEVHDADLETDAVASAEHQAFIAKVNEVITDMENISDSEFMAGKDEFFDRLWVARDTLATHEDTTEFLQEAGVAHHLLEASVMATENFGTNITAITDSINQAKSFLVAHVNDFGETDALANIKTNIDSVLANIENVNNNEFTTATMVAIKTGIKQAFSDAIDHLNTGGHNLCGNPELPCYNTEM